MLGFISLLFSKHNLSQLILDRQVISCLGMDYSGSSLVSATAGQIDYTTLQSQGGFITQGFHQPTDVPALQVTLEVFNLECSVGYDVRIVSIHGCNNLDNVSIFWNGIQGEMTQNNLPANTNLLITTNGDCAYTANYNFETYAGTVRKSCELEFFNYISPNNDGDNDVWQIKNVDRETVQSAEVKVFGRWGTLVWEGSSYDNKTVVWKGKDQKGADLPDGTYYYVATINDKTYNGYIELIR